MAESGISPCVPVAAQYSGAVPFVIWINPLDQYALTDIDSDIDVALDLSFHAVT